MAVAELSETSTKEEIESFVNDIAEARAGDQAEAAKPEKSDAEIVNDVSSIETTAAPKGDETAEADKGKGETTDDRAWLDDDLKAEVAAYGIGEDTLADFSSREEVERALRFFDKSALEAGRKAMAESESKETGRDDKGRFTKRDTETAAKAEPEKKPGATASYEIKLDKAKWDDDIVDEFTRMRDHYEARLAAAEESNARLDTLEARFAQVDAEAEERHFDSLVDSLGHADLFGKADKEDAKQLQRRKDLHVAVKAQMLGLTALGRPTEMSESLVNRVARMVFAEELGRKDLKSRTSKISKQSNGRQGGGATRPNEPRENPRDEADRLYKELAGS